MFARITGGTSQQQQEDAGNQPGNSAVMTTSHFEMIMQEMKAMRKDCIDNSRGMVQALEAHTNERCDAIDAKLSAHVAKSEGALVTLTSTVKTQIARLESLIQNQAIQQAATCEINMADEEDRSEARMAAMQVLGQKIASSITAQMLVHSNRSGPSSSTAASRNSGFSIPANRDVKTVLVKGPPLLTESAQEEIVLALIT